MSATAEHTTAPQKMEFKTELKQLLDLIHPFALHQEGNLPARINQQCGRCH